MLNMEKLEKAVQSPVYLAYCNLIAAAILRAAMGDTEARQEILDLQREQDQIVRAAMDTPS